MLYRIRLTFAICFFLVGSCCDGPGAGVCDDSAGTKDEAGISVGFVLYQIETVVSPVHVPFRITINTLRDHPIFFVLSLLEILVKHRFVGTKRQMVGTLEVLVVGLWELPVSS